MKNITKTILLGALISPSYILGGVVETCNSPVTTDYFPLGDTSGKSVLTRRNVSQECNLTISEQGPCIAWDENVQNFGLQPDTYNTYRSEDNEDSINDLFATMGLYDQLDHLWSGWHGYCEKGTKSDFSWASDPAYWGSLAVSVALDYASGGTTGGGENALATGAQSAKDSAVSGIQALGSTVGLAISERMAGCMIKAGVDLTFAAARNRLANGSLPDCDPIDEFCEEEEVSEEEVITMRLEVYNDIIQNPDYADMLIIIPPIEGDTVSVRYIKPNEVEGFSDLSKDKQQEMRDKMNDLALKIDVVMAVGGLAYCGVTGDSSSNTNIAGADEDRATIKAGASMGINLVPSALMGPYGPLIKAGMQVLLSVGTSYKHVNSCTNAEDATELGSRHLKTQQSLEYNLCHKTAKTCSEEPLIGHGCALVAYNYCCYDQILTKTLSEQIKVQLGRDWRHCTGISIKDLKYVSFRECDAQDKSAKDADGNDLVDGVSFYDTYSYPDKSDDIFDPTRSYQYVRKCIDMKDFKDILGKSANENVDITDFKADANRLSGRSH